ncbi:MAG: type II toxin-antitoxin system VapC family toxin [Nitrospirales bacterium]|nr:type II toxin-antitoxin system VapC family toxin [Nitrospirales bacterium]
MRNAEHELYWSAASYWELTVKLSLGKLRLQKEWQSVLEREKKVNRILDLPIYERHCERHLTLPWHHRDPFDRLLICQALTEHMILLTKDEMIAQYPVKNSLVSNHPDLNCLLLALRLAFPSSDSPVTSIQSDETNVPGWPPLSVLLCSLSRKVDRKFRALPVFLCHRAVQSGCLS